MTADGDSVTVRSRAPWAGTAEVAPQALRPLARPVRAVHVSLAGWDHVSELDVVPPDDPILFFSADGRWLPAQLPLPPDQLWILRPADRELTTVGELRVITESPVPSGWAGWHLQLGSLEKVSSLALPGGPAHAVRGDTCPRLLLGEPFPGVTTPDGSPVYAEPPKLWLPDLPDLPGPAARWHVGIRPAAGGSCLVSREIGQAGTADIWDGVPRPILGAFDIIVRGPLGRWMRRTIFIAAGVPVSFGVSDRAHMVDLHAGTGTEPLASGAEVSSGQLTIRDCAPADGLAAALYLARAPWRAPVIVTVPGDGVVKLPADVCGAGPLRVLLRGGDPGAVTDWPELARPRLLRVCRPGHPGQRRPGRGCPVPVPGRGEGPARATPPGGPPVAAHPPGRRPDRRRRARRSPRALLGRPPGPAPAGDDRAPRRRA